jgi:hypothetical protein
MLLAYYPITLKYFWRIFHVHLNYFQELARIHRSFRLHLDPVLSMYDKIILAFSEYDQLLSLSFPNEQN